MKSLILTISPFHDTKRNVARSHVFHKEIEHYSFDVFFKINASGVITDYGPYIQQFNENKRLIGKKLEDALPEEFSVVLKKATISTLKEKGAEVIDFSVNRNSKHYWYEVKIVPLTSLETLINIKNITKQIVVEENLRESEQRFRKAVVNLPLPIIIYAEDGVVIQLNKAFTKKTGYSQKEIPTMDVWFKTMYGSSDPSREKHIKKLFKISDQYTSGEHTIKTSSGEKLQWIFSSVPLGKLADGRKIIMSVAVDVTEQKLYEKKILQNEAKLKRIMDSNIIGLFFWNIDGTITDANDEFLEMTGYSREDLKNQKVNWINITPSEWGKRDAEVMTELMKKGKVTPYEKEFLSKDGVRVPILLGAAATETKYKSGIAFAMDLTRIKELEKQREMYLGVVGHEIKSPLASMKSLVQILEMKARKRNDIETSGYLQKIDQKINKLTKLINDVMDISRIRAGKLEMHHEFFNFDDFVYETVEDIQEIETKHEFVIKGKTGKEVMADKIRIGQVLINLLSNAAKYSPDANKVIVTLSSNQNEVSLSVQDFGIGIPETMKNKLFQPFYQLQDKTAAGNAGLGLGLFIASSIIRQHKGSITVESKQGIGSTFTITIPANISN